MVAQAGSELLAFNLISEGSYFKKFHGFLCQQQLIRNHSLLRSCKLFNRPQKILSNPPLLICYVVPHPLKSPSESFFIKLKELYKYLLLLLLLLLLLFYETWSLKLREESRLRVFENRILKRIFELKRDKNGKWRRLYNDEPNIEG